MAELFFGDYRLDTKKLRLRGADSSAVEIRAKALELLLYLIENRDRFVGRKELLEKVWPSVTVTGASLTQCISELRHALDDSAAEPRYVETKIKKGYRFIAPIYHKPTERLELLPPPRTLVPSSTGTGSRRGWIVAAVAAALVAASAVVAITVFLSPKQQRTLSVGSTHSQAEHPLTGELADATRSLVVSSIQSIPDVEMVESTGENPHEAAYQIEIESSSWHGIRMELKISLLETDSRERLWGWTWVVPQEALSIEPTAATAAQEVAAAVRQHLGGR